jgi:hypothetical protein
MLLDGGSDGEIPSKAGKMKPLQQGDDGFACFRSRGIPYGDLFGVSGAILLPPRLPKRSRSQDRRVTQA